MNQKTKERNDNGFTRHSDDPAAPQGNSAGQSRRGEERKGGGTPAGGTDRGTGAAGQKKAPPVETACQQSDDDDGEEEEEEEKGRTDKMEEGRGRTWGGRESRKSRICLS